MAFHAGSPHRGSPSDLHRLSPATPEVVGGQFSGFTSALPLEELRWRVPVRNSLRVIKHIVEEDLGIKFDLRQCRRTFGQRYLDKDLDIESVSVLMGHASTKTTEGFYSRKRLDRAIENAIGTWNDNGGQ